ncbi:hypothetical protein B0J17DRAFT_120295 [Rhizoctonia solani]|nr:hypothetical protein B0J17DRAFT_120295 [Rhizoctonia solani]
MSGAPVVFSSVMWTPSDKYGPLVTRRRGSGTASHAVRGAQPCIASRRTSVDARRRSVCTASANSLGQSAQPEVKAPKSVRWLLEEHKFPTDEPQEDKIRMPVPVPVKHSVSKPAFQPPACRPFHILELPVYHPEDVRAELNTRLLKTLNDIVPLCQLVFTFNTKSIPSARNWPIPPRPVWYSLPIISLISCVTFVASPATSLC